MKLSPCSIRSVLQSCGLENFNYQLDPYIGCEHYCYYCYVLPQAETNWREEVLVYEDIVDQLSAELHGIAPQTIYMGYHADPYQPCEAESQQTRKVLQLLLEKGFSASILTKSDLVLRDIDILQKMKEAAISVSVAFNDTKIRQLFEERTVETGARIAALTQLKDAGIKTGSLLCPVVPYITEPMELIDQLEPCADEIWVYGLSFMEKSDQSWQNTKNILTSHYPNIAENIEEIIFSKDHNYWTELRGELQALKEKRSLNLNIYL